jgi:hypothetical protein
VLAGVAYWCPVESRRFGTFNVRAANAAAAAANDPRLQNALREFNALLRQEQGGGAA